MSVPSWERCLKHGSTEGWASDINVVPLVGTWIETGERISDADEHEVVPLVGTWIETEDRGGSGRTEKTSFPSWERGLKLAELQDKLKDVPESFPSWERGLKHI